MLHLTQQSLRGFSHAVHLSCVAVGGYTCICPSKHYNKRCFCDALTCGVVGCSPPHFFAFSGRHNTG